VWIIYERELSKKESNKDELLKIEVDIIYEESVRWKGDCVERREKKG